MSALRFGSMEVSIKKFGPAIVLKYKWATVQRRVDYIILLERIVILTTLNKMEIMFRENSGIGRLKCDRVVHGCTDRVRL